MALKGNLPKENPINPYRIDFEEAYFKIDGININVLKDEVKVKIRAYASEYSRQNFGMGIFKKIINLKLEDFKSIKCSKDEILKSVYIKLKEIDDFKDLGDHKKKYKGKVEHIDINSIPDEKNVSNLDEAEEVLEKI